MVMGEMGVVCMGSDEVLVGASMAGSVDTSMGYLATRPLLGPAVEG